MRTSFGWEDRDGCNLFHSWISALVADKTVWSNENACHTGALLWWGWSVMCMWLQEDSCLIAKQCYGPGEQSPDDNCLICRPKISRTEFSTNEGLHFGPDWKFHSRSVSVAQAVNVHEINLIEHYCTVVDCGFTTAWQGTSLEITVPGYLRNQV